MAKLWDELTVAANGAIADFTEANAITDSFKIKQKIINKTGDNGTKKLNNWQH